jgi:hypothetical protein
MRGFWYLRLQPRFLRLVTRGFSRVLAKSDGKAATESERLQF